jgi:hypothetical protein
VGTPRNRRGRLGPGFVASLEPGVRIPTVAVTIVGGALEVLAKGLTSPPMPPGPRGDIGGAFVPAPCAPRGVPEMTDVEGCDALAARSPPAMSGATNLEKMPAFLSTFWRDVCFMSGSLSESVWGFRDRNIFSNECVEVIGRT